MGRSRYKIYEEHYPYFITSTFYKQSSLLADPKVAKIVMNALEFLQNERGIKLYAFVLMHDHFHCIVEGENLSEKLRKFKSYTARLIIDYLIETNRIYALKQLRFTDPKNRSEHKVWQEGFHPKQINSLKIMQQKIEYIHYNPVKAGFVDMDIDWRYSSARNYSGMDGLIAVNLFEG